MSIQSSNGGDSMAYCNYCGEYNTDDSDFCKRCGKMINNTRYNYNNYSSSRDTVYVGNIRRCPVCNEIVPNIATVCNSCGFQFNNTLINPTLERFSSKIQSFDAQIPTEKNDIYYIKKKSKENKPSGITIILLTIFSLLTLFSMFWFIPVVFIYIILLFKQPTNDKTPPVLTQSELGKSNFIENFVYPNDSETIIELLQYIKNKIRITAELKADKDSLYWSNIWLNKAEQLYSKSRVSLGNDTIVEQIYQDIKSLHLNYLQNYKKNLLKQRPFVLVKFLSGLAFSFRLIFIIFSPIS